MPIHFGTDGWRAVISDTFTFSNLRMVAQAIADAVGSGAWLNGNLSASSIDSHRVVVGFDTRFLSDRYAKEVARVLAANGFTVYLAQADAPTPAISHAVKYMNAIAGIMITASHNAPRYNGVKLKAAYGGSALPEQCRRVEVYLNDNEAQARGPNLMDFDLARTAGLIQRFNPTLAYYEHLRSLIDFDLIADNPQRIVVDSMFGAGRGWIRGALQGTGCEIAEIRGELNPGFGGVHPEPIARYLGALAGAISTGLGDFGLATDGDADRIGAMDERGNFVDPHKIMALALRYLVEKRGWSGAVVRTVSTTRMVDRLAARYGLPVFETPVGFNHIADHMLSGDVLIGGEESGGISFKGHIPEGDGVIMGLMIVEMVAAARKSLYEMVKDLLDDVGPAYYERTDLRLNHPVSKDQMSERLYREAPAEIGGEKVAQVSVMDGVKYIMGDDSWLLIRPSGTEPVLRVYAEGRTQQMVKDLLGYGEQVAASVS
ncbi:MAG TPA: phosphoglucomutase/phosphomannomutase family protein [Anaerolineaceae bacterium]|nr:phosphoglucomutase/phosphomannomutase family protein [Anaerolineaceae bacterium]NMD30893.1 phosphoglucomutase/phosphomannomutase family protein [Chloroflexota bacterium]HNZ01723.1 phosphoglucomutase/phosphomannomutase family protein [Anaerolineaceae bacterium]HOH20852.1 phosphoglucomutase/phosphomannomutase family protein [Anaerolineaceae bacterium]HOU44920.1 phosphoglucomutase/phosphomannomutase family protein [Anaerolineaceae bacterium]